MEFWKQVGRESLHQLLILLQVQISFFWMAQSLEALQSRARYLGNQEKLLNKSHTIPKQPHTSTTRTNWWCWSSGAAACWLASLYRVAADDTQLSWSGTVVQLHLTTEWRQLITTTPPQPALLGFNVNFCTVSNTKLTFWGFQKLPLTLCSKLCDSRRHFYSYHIFVHHQLLNWVEPCWLKKSVLCPQKEHFAGRTCSDLHSS